MARQVGLAPNCESRYVGWFVHRMESAASLDYLNTLVQYPAADILCSVDAYCGTPDGDFHHHTMLWVW